MKIFGHNYKVTLDGRLDFDERQSGLIHFGNLTIKISALHPESRQQEALLHEIIEAINKHLELDLKHCQITALGESFYQILSDNGLYKPYDFKGEKICPTKLKGNVSIRKTLVKK